MNGPRGAAVAVIDVGSNSIKSLVARRAPDGSVQALSSQTIDARISAGIGDVPPRLGADGMARGVEAVRALLAGAAAFAPARTALVSTSAVRDAENGVDFCAQVRAETGHNLRILTGNEEANLIGRGLTADPALRALQNFYVFDLGGGSLECLTFRRRKIEQAISLQLGCVRLTERFIADPRRPVAAGLRAEVAAEVRREMARAGFAFSLPVGAAAIGTGGTVATVRSIIAARERREFDATDPRVSLSTIRELLDWLGAMPLEARQRITGLPAARADVFPAALATLIAVADAGRFNEFRNSLYNLRYGLADELLAATP